MTEKFSADSDIGPVIAHLRDPGYDPLLLPAATLGDLRWMLESEFIWSSITKAHAAGGGGPGTTEADYGPAHVDNNEGAACVLRAPCVPGQHPRLHARAGHQLPGADNRGGRSSPASSACCTPGARASRRPAALATGTRPR